jgi:hypothetical protein
MSLFVRFLFLAGGLIASWFIEADAPQYPIIQVIFGIIVVTVIVAILAFWKEIKRWLLTED